MSDIRQWTPIQEGRFHLRSMRDGESIQEYVSRTYTRGQRRIAMEKIAPLIRRARAERDKALTAKAESEAAR